jgi:hypothetical protein
MKVIHRKLGREHAYGQALLGENTIEIDSKLKKRKHLEIMIHEIMHILNPKMSETQVLKQSKKMAMVLWKEGYRQCDV